MSTTELLRDSASRRTASGSVASEPMPFAVGIKEACRLTGMGQTMIYTAARSGELPRIKVGMRTLFRPADLAAWIERKATTSTAK